jgi:GxxExxY protein
MDFGAEINAVSGQVVDTAYGLHKRIGPGLLESVYEAALARLLEKRGLFVERQKRVVFELDGIRFDDGLRIDLLVEKSVVVEIKSAEALLPVHAMQVLTYLRLSRLQVGLLINFGAPILKQGLRRIVNSYPQTPSASPSPPRLRVNEPAKPPMPEPQN